MGFGLKYKYIYLLINIMVKQFMNMNQEKFEHVIDLLILYKTVNPKKDVYLSEKSIKDAIEFMNKYGNEFADKLGLKTDK